MATKKRKATPAAPQIGAGVAISRVEFDLGNTRHGRPVRLVRERRNGVTEFSLVREAGDDGQGDRVTLSGITPEMFAKAAKASRVES